MAGSRRPKSSVRAARQSGRVNQPTGKNAASASAHSPARTPFIALPRSVRGRKRQQHAAQHHQHDSLAPTHRAAAQCYANQWQEREEGFPPRPRGIWNRGQFDGHAGGGGAKRREPGVAGGVAGGSVGTFCVGSFTTIGSGTASE